jgi:acetylornithine deacetylase/succinyl-diaminopimelate desuccinylase-like protein
VQDDGAGVIIAMAAAKLAANMEPKPRRTIRVIGFANEEFGLSGAFEYPADEGKETSIVTPSRWRPISARGPSGS